MTELEKLDQKVEKMKAERADREARKKLQAEEARRIAEAQKEDLSDAEMIIGGIMSGLTPRTPEEMARYVWVTETLERLRGSRLPDRYHKKIKDWGQPRQEAVYKACEKFMCRMGAIVALIGPRGVGKTMIAAQMIIKRAEDESLHTWERQPPYRKLTDILARFKPLYADFGSIDTESLISQRDSFCDQPFVVIDEIHDCEDQKMADRILTDILDRRYSRERDTLLISNQIRDIFNKSTNQSIISRLNEHGGIISCEWPSWRD